MQSRTRATALACASIACVLAADARALADEPPPKVAKLPRLQAATIPGVDLPTGADMRDTALDQVKQVLPDPDKLAEWFQGHGGAILGTGTMVVAPLGYTAGGDKNSFYRSHLPGAGLFGEIGMLFLRRWGVKAHGGYVEHLKGTDRPDGATSWQIGISGLYLFKPEQKSPYLELGVVRNSYSSQVSVYGGTADRSSASYDGRIGLGYMVLTKEQKFLYTPWVAFDFGRFGDVTQTLNGADSTIDYADKKAWHYVISAGITFAYHKKVPALVGPVPKTRPDDPDGDLILDPYDRCPNEKEDYYPPDPKDGCPSNDWDQDAVPNSEDACPRVKGIHTNDPKTNGCPEQAPPPPAPPPPEPTPAPPPPAPEPPKVEIKDTSISIPDHIYFDAGSATINAKSGGLLDDIADVLKKNPQVELVEIQGHADNVGTAAGNLGLTQARANSVRQALVQRGVEPTRLVAVGYGEFCPLEPNAPNRGGNDKNRRVELRVLRTAGKPTGAETACAEAKKFGIKGTDPNAKGPAK